MAPWNPFRMAAMRPVRLAVTALPIASVAVMVSPSATTTLATPVHQGAATPVATTGRTSERQGTTVPTLPPVSVGRVDVERRVAAAFATDTGDIPVTAMLAYQHAAIVLDEVDGTCALTWTMLAAIGDVESDHGRSGGAVLDEDGLSNPLIRGIRLDGRGPVAEVADTDAGQTDGDKRWDRAVGPMQFLPATWDTVGVDADGDGQRSADDLDDAAMGAAVFLCAAPGTLDSRSGVRAALHRYNASWAYVARVIALEHAYRIGDYRLSDLPYDGPGVIRAVAVIHGGEHPQQAPSQQADHAGSHQQGGGGSGPAEPSPTNSPDPTTNPPSVPLPTPTPTPDPSPAPDPSPTPDPDPSPDPEPSPDPAQVEPTEVTGVLRPCGTDPEVAWCLDASVLDVGDTEDLAASALSDFDADGTVETNAEELAGLAGTEVTVTVMMRDDAPPRLLSIGGRDYTVADDTASGVPLLPG